MTKIHFCEKCNKVIKVSETPWCSQCRKKMLTDIFERSDKIKKLTKMMPDEKKESEEVDDKEEAEETIDNLPDIDDEEENLV